MNSPDPFEQRLSRQPVKAVPPAWRDEILRVAKRAERVERNPTPARSGFIAALREQVAAVLWLRPRAWAALGAAWLLILTVNLMSRDDGPATFVHAQPASGYGPKDAWQLKVQMLAELGLVELSPAAATKAIAPRPRSQRRAETMNA